MVAIVAKSSMQIYCITDGSVAPKVLFEKRKNVNDEMVDRVEPASACCAVYARPSLS